MLEPLCGLGELLERVFLKLDPEAGPLGQGEAPGAPVHIALTSPSRKIVDAFHAAALEAGGRDNGAPGIRAHYHKDYYGAFVIDPDGNNIEAVCHDPKG